MNSRVNGLKNSKTVWYGISTLILLGLIYLADVDKFIGALSSIKPLNLSISFFFGLCIFPVWGYVWHSLFKKMGMETTLRNSYKMFMAGNFMNSVTPLGQLGGEPFMAYIVSKNTDASYEKSLSAVVSADLVNAIPFIVYMIVGISYLFFFGAAMSGVIRRATYIAMTLILVLGLAAYLVWFRSDLLRNRISGLLKAVNDRTKGESKIIRILDEKIESLWDAFEEAGKDPLHLIKLTLFSHIAPLTQLACLYFILSGMGITPDFTGVFLTVILGGLAMWSPTPGGAGTVEAAFSALLVFFYPGIGLDTAVASAVLFRLTTFWPGILIGYIALISLRRNRK